MTEILNTKTGETLCNTCHDPESALLLTAVSDYVSRPDLKTSEDFKKYSDEIRNKMDELQSNIHNSSEEFITKAGHKVRITKLILGDYEVIKSKKILPNHNIELTIDKNGPDGNAFIIMKKVVECMKMSNTSSDDISDYLNNAMKGDYDSLCKLSEKYVKINWIN